MIQITGDSDGSPGGSSPPTDGLLNVRASVDSATDDNGFLRGVYDSWRRCGDATTSLHGTTAAAFANIQGGSAKFSLLCGHGLRGQIICGTGQIVGSEDQYMGWRNAPLWRPMAAEGVVGAQLTLFGCKIAEGHPGGYFLRQVADAIHKPVGAWTGDVWSDGRKTWGTGNFVVIRPGQNIEDAMARGLLASPVMFRESGRPAMKVMRFAPLRDSGEIPIGQVRSVRFTPTGSVVARPGVQRAEGDDARSLLTAIDFNHPLVTNARPAAIMTGLLSIHYETKNEEHVRVYRVLGYSLLQDVSFPTTYLHASSRFQTMLFAGDGPVG